MNRKLFVGIGLASALATSAWGQAGDRDGHVMKEVWRDMDVPPAPVLTPDEALKSFTLQPGFRIEIVAADPLLEDPVAMDIDEKGRLWVVEMRGYMPNVDGKGEDARVGRISVLEDTDGDGRMDKRTVFLDGLQMPRAVALSHQGVLVAEPPHLWLCTDSDGDLKCDDKTEIVSNYGLQGPVEHTDNGLLHAVDNWIYNAKSTKRIRFMDGKWVVEDNFFRGQWGITQDDYGRIFYNNNSNPLYVDLVPASYMTRNPNFSTTSGLNQKVFRSNDVWTGRVNPGINRGYQDSMLRNGHLAVWTAASGPVIYRGDQYPAELRGAALIPEPSGNMIRLQTVEHSQGKVTGDNVYKRKEWLTSTDERFRPVNLYNAPDGTVYIVDMYRGILQHRAFVTSFLRKQIIERGLDKPLGLGRIYRVVHEDKPLTPIPAEASATGSQLASLINHPGGFWRDTAQRLILSRKDVQAVPALRELAVTAPAPESRVKALWILEGLGALDVTTLSRALTDKHPQVRVAAIRTSEVLLSKMPDDEEEAQALTGLLIPLFELAQDADVDVTRQLTLSLSGLQVPQVEPVLRKLVMQRGSDSVILDGLLAGLGGRELEFLQRLLVSPEADPSSKVFRPLISQLAGCVALERNPGRIARLFDVAEGAASDLQVAMLEGMATAVNPKRGRKPKPVHFNTQPVAMAKLLAAKDKKVSATLAKLSDFITFGAEAAPPPPPRPLTAQEKEWFDNGKMLYQFTCAACHLETGLGEEGKAPPLLDSPYLLGDARIAIGIVTHGLTGPVELFGRTYDMTMPALQGFEPAQIANILTYARREWDHGADPVSPEQVEAFRKAYPARETPWLIQELAATPAAGK